MNFGSVPGWAIVRHVCSDENLPQARAGLDVGEVVAFGADYVGRPVNIASRITAYALPDTTVISQAMLDAFPEGELNVAKIGSRTLKGVGRVRMYKVREEEP